MIGGFGLQIIGFPDNATTETITQETLNGLFFMMGPLYWMICFTGMLFMGMYQLNKNKHAEILEELKSEELARYTLRDNRIKHRKQCEHRNREYRAAAAIKT